MYDFRQKKIAKIVRNKRKVIDLGFADIPNKYLSNSEIIGVDIQKAEKPSNYTSIICENVMNIESFFEKNSIDAIISGELFEHLYYPIDFLKGCNKILNDNGIIVISTPNPHYLMEIFLNTFMIKKIYYSKDHICIYPQRWLIRMFELAGFKKVKILSGGFSIPYLGTYPFIRSFGQYSIVVAYK